MTLPVTIALLALGAVLTGLFGWLGARPKTLGRPQMVPWQLLMMVAAAWCLMMIVHLLNLLGAHTGGGQ
jgi:hypothetical protein